MKSMVKQAIIQGVIFSLIFIALVWASILLSGQQQLKVSKAVVCVLTLPVDETGRDELHANDVCMVGNGLEPIDSDGDGIIEVTTRDE